MSGCGRSSEPLVAVTPASEGDKYTVRFDEDDSEIPVLPKHIRACEHHRATDTIILKSDTVSISKLKADGSFTVKKELKVDDIAISACCIENEWCDRRLSGPVIIGFESPDKRASEPRRTILKIPSSFTNNLPSKTMSIAQLLLFELPPPGDSTLNPMDDDTEWFTDEQVSPNLEELLPFLTVPSGSVAKQLLNKFGQAWFDGRKTLHTWINPEIRLSIWVLTYWAEILDAALPANSFLALLPKDELVKTFHNHVEIGAQAQKIFGELVAEKEVLAKAVASLNTVRRKGKANIHIMELPEDEYIED
ncbi:hypothetical protein DFH09DRAFT_1331613 [Mycena vulgaris]|nr:hypothetical protein DFH09DRAFT_1331613 [Mycena vulgaris]